jgi:hypothetical protein
LLIVSWFNINNIVNTTTTTIINQSTIINRSRTGADDEPRIVADGRDAQRPEARRQPRRVVADRLQRAVP